ncbi:MAG: adenine phosphoribosyltransferase, partial [Treponema sp.]|nr:adenine phosphoribosyltransferase [Treponema sp.]
MERQLNLDDYIRKVPDFPQKGVLFYDITSIL